MPIADVKQKECLYRCQLKPTLGDCYRDLFESTRCSLTSMAHLHVRRKLGLVQCLHMDGRMKLVLFTLVLPEVRRCFKMWMRHMIWSQQPDRICWREMDFKWMKDSNFVAMLKSESPKACLALSEHGQWSTSNQIETYEQNLKHLFTQAQCQVRFVQSFQDFRLRCQVSRCWHFVGLRRSAPPLCRRMPCASTGSSPRGPWRCRPRNCRRRRDRIAVKSQHFHPGRKSSQGMPGYARVCQGVMPHGFSQEILFDPAFGFFLALKMSTSHSASFSKKNAVAWINHESL